MAELLYIYPFSETNSSAGDSIRWLEAEDIDIFNQHLAACGQKPIAEKLWKEIYSEGTMYCGKFIGNLMVARACVEKYSDEYWEVADVRTAREYRNCGCAAEVCTFVLNYILSQNKNATIRTEEDNVPMQRVITHLGFVPFGAE